jgi:N6-adenosine-specific RNA methylase IME4/ParB-like chromosome segregation protein Spo0J
MRAEKHAQSQIDTRPPQELRGHPQAALVPSMSVAEAEALEADIARRGVVVPLEITEAGLVLDGRHRHRVALKLGLEQVPVRLVDPPDPVEYMLLAALQRRQLSESQRAALVLELAEYREQQARARARRKRNLRNSGLDVASVPNRAGRTRDLAAELAGVSPRLVQQAERLRTRDPVRFEKAKAGQLKLGTALKEIEREERYAEIGPTPPLPAGTFDLIYADPPWQLGSPASSNSPEQHYPTLATGKIVQLAVPGAEDAVLFLWAVTCLLPDALEVINAWGFSFKAGLVWVKPSIGLGNYMRNRHELLLFATRGSYPVPPPERRPDSVVEAGRGRHSQKPVRFYELIEQMYPHARRLELFARGKPRPGWTTWGNEASE